MQKEAKEICIKECENQNKLCTEYGLKYSYGEIKVTYKCYEPNSFAHKWHSAQK